MGQLVTVNGTVVPTAEEALVVTQVTAVRRVLARLGLEERALTFLFILTDGVDTSDTWVDTALTGTPTTTILVATLTTLVTLLPLPGTRTFGPVPPLTRGLWRSPIITTGRLVHPIILDHLLLTQTFTLTTSLGNRRTTFRLSRVLSPQTLKHLLARSLQRILQGANTLPPTLLMKIYQEPHP